MVLVDNFFQIFQIIIFCFVVTIFDLVQDVEAIHDLCLLLIASGNLFWNMSDAPETAICIGNYYAPNFEKVGGAYCFWSVRGCVVCAWVTLFGTYSNF